MTTTRFIEMALSLADVQQAPHFRRTSFRIKGKIFATLHEQTGVATLKLSPIDQFGFCSGNQSCIYPVPNKWGQQGWTSVELKGVPETLLKQVLQAAYAAVLKPAASKKQASAKKGKK